MQKGLLRPEQLEQALQQQRSSGELLGAVLLQMRFIQPEVLLTTLAEQFGMAHERLRPEQVDWAVVEQFRASALSSGSVFPIRADAESVTVAIANPLDVGALSAIEKAAGFRTVKPILVLEEDLRSVQQAYRQRSLRKIASQLDPHGSDQTS